MEFKKEKLQIIKNALQYAVLNAKTESEEAEFALMLLDIHSAIISEAEQEKRIEALKSLEGCVFKYCPYTPKCQGTCNHSS